MGESPCGCSDNEGFTVSGMDATPAQVSDRTKRIKVLDAIVNCLQKKKPSWQKARILHLSTQLEESIFNAEDSLTEYADPSTLPERINHHCLLLATRKTTCSKPVAPPPSFAVNGNVHSFAAESNHFPFHGSESTGPNVSDDGSANSTGTVVHGISGGPGDKFVLEPIPVAPFAQAVVPEAERVGELVHEDAKRGKAVGGTGEGYPLAGVVAGRARGVATPTVVDLSVDSPVDPYTRQQQHLGGVCGGGDEAGGGVAVPSCTLSGSSNVGAGVQAPLTSILPSSACPRLPSLHTFVGGAVDGSNGPHSSSSSSSSHGETTADDVDDDDYDEDDGKGDQGYDEGDKATAKSVRAPSPLAMPRGPHDPSPSSGADADAVAAASMPRASIDTRAPHDPAQELLKENENHDDSSLATIIAAASLGGTEWRGAWSGEMHATGSFAVHAGGRVGGVGELSRLFENGQQLKAEPHPEAVEQEARKHALRLLQCRLLLLTHAAGCSEKFGCCRLAPLCDSVRQLLLHMQSCGDKSSCSLPHCNSSKAVLRHKHMCSDSACSLCSSVKEISQKCFWANARHLHKRRLEESQELRRQKRRSEGKIVAPPRKPQQPEKVKVGKEVCAGLDEAGNDLGDISLGFFLRQEKAVKARKMLSQASSNDGHENPNPPVSDSTSTDLMGTSVASNITPGASSTSSSVVSFPSRGPVQTTTTTSSVGHGDGNTHETVVTRQAPLPRGSSPPVTKPSPVQTGGEMAHPSPAQLAATSPAFPTPSPESPALRQQAPLEDPSTGVQVEAHEGSDKAKGAVCAATVEAMDVEDVSGGGAEASSAGASSGGNGGVGHGHGLSDGHDQRKSEENGGGLTVVVPPVGSGAVVGHLRNPCEILLDEITESLADTTRKPSFARMQSVQAFLDDHVELRQSASFGDVSAMVEQWMAIDQSDDPEHLEESAMGAFSF